MSLKAKRKVVSSIPPMDGGTYGGQTLFSFPAVCGRKEVARMQKKAFRLFVCAAVLLYIFCIKAR